MNKVRYLVGREALDCCRSTMTPLLKCWLLFTQGTTHLRAHAHVRTQHTNTNRFKWKPWLFSQVAKGYWDSAENIRQVYHHSCTHTYIHSTYKYILHSKCSFTHTTYIPVHHVYVYAYLCSFYKLNSMCKQQNSVINSQHPLSLPRCACVCVCVMCVCVGYICACVYVNVHFVMSFSCFLLLLLLAAIVVCCRREGEGC